MYAAGRVVASTVLLAHMSSLMLMYAYVRIGMLTAMAGGFHVWIAVNDCGIMQAGDQAVSRAISAAAVPDDMQQLDFTPLPSSVLRRHSALPRSVRRLALGERIMHSGPGGLR